MSDKENTELKIYDHVPNSGIIHMPYRRYPAVAIQGDSLSIIFSTALRFLEKSKEIHDEDLFYDALELAQSLKSHLARYEAVLEKEGFDKPYTTDIYSIDLDQEF